MSGESSVAEQAQRVQLAFDGRAASWSQGYVESGGFRSHNFLSRRRAVLELLGAARGECRVLDAGCGTGDYIPELLALGWRVWGVDLSPAMVEQTRARFRERRDVVQIDAGRVERLPYGAASFDAVICAGVLEYVGDDGQALSEVQRVLRPGGVMIVTVPNILSPWMQMDRAVSHLRRFGGDLLERLALFERLLGRPRLNRWYAHRHYRPAALNALLRQRGFRLEGFRFSGFGSFVIGEYVPWAAASSRWYEHHFRQHPVLGLIGLNYIVRAVQP